MDIIHGNGKKRRLVPFPEGMKEGKLPQRPDGAGCTELTCSVAKSKLGVYW